MKKILVSILILSLFLVGCVEFSSGPTGQVSSEEPVKGTAEIIVEESEEQSEEQLQEQSQEPDLESVEELEQEAESNEEELEQDIEQETLAETEEPAVEEESEEQLQEESQEPEEVGVTDDRIVAIAMNEVEGEFVHKKLSMEYGEAAYVVEIDCENGTTARVIIPIATEEVMGIEWD